MESRKFDDLTKALASGTTRRGVLKGMIGGAVGGALGMLGLSRGAAQPADRVSICHREGNGSFHVIEVSANALPAHEAHGDLVSCPEDFELNLETCTCECALTCEAPFVLDEESCSCVCGLTCEAPFVLDEASCTCVCDLTCEAPFVLDEASCTCLCGLTDDDCPNLEVIDPDTCSCFCPVESIVCEPGTVFNPDTCSCDADQGNQPCDTFQCGEGPCATRDLPFPQNVCACFELVESPGNGLCLGDFLCGSTDSCNGDADCPDGWSCVTNTCCGAGVQLCAPPCPPEGSMSILGGESSGTGSTAAGQ